MRLAARSAMLAAGALAVTAPGAGADIIAFTSATSQSPSTNLDIVKIDTSTGTYLKLPAGLNTPDSENHPSVSADGTRLVFERHSFTANTDRIVLTNLTTGQSTDVFTGFEAASATPISPSITPDAKTVLTGGPFQPIGGSPEATVTLSDVSTFPSGPPYAHSISKPGYGFLTGTVGHTQDAVASGSLPSSLVAYREVRSGANGQLILGTLGGNASSPLVSGVLQYAHPALGSPGGSPIVAFDQRPATPGSSNLGAGDIVFRPATTAGFVGPPTQIPGVDTSASETRPAFTPDGRYLGFIRNTAGVDKLLIWDSQTQTIVNGSGFTIGSVAVQDSGALSLYEQFILRVTGITNTGTVSFDLASSSGVGILVQRVVGHHKLFGRSVPTLKPVGRVPFGKFAKGRGHVKWDFKVNGERLPRGTYQVTVRAVTPKLQILDLGTPRIIKVR